LRNSTSQKELYIPGYFSSIKNVPSFKAQAVLEIEAGGAGTV